MQAAVNAAATGLYYLLPTLDPFGERTNALLRTMRVAESDWQDLAAGAGYAARRSRLLMSRL